MALEYLSDLKAILHSKRANIYYIEKARIMVKDGRVVFLTETKNESQYWNIPIANTTVILLGTGTSITQAAVRMIASAGVLLGFSGSGGTPLFAGSEVEWITPQSEYRPTEYLQGWLSFWFDDEKRLEVAKSFQKYRIEFIAQVWNNDKYLQDFGFYADDVAIEKTLTTYSQQISRALTINELLRLEADMTKRLYKFAAQKTGVSKFVRDRDTPIDTVNIFLNHGNYLAYGLAVMHGKTRRGALIFDVADLVKDAMILPFAFVAAKENMKEQEFRELCLQNFTKHKVMDYMFSCIKKHASFASPDEDSGI